MVHRVTLFSFLYLVIGLGGYLWALDGEMLLHSTIVMTIPAAAPTSFYIHFYSFKEGFMDNNYYSMTWL